MKISSISICGARAGKIIDRNKIARNSLGNAQLPMPESLRAKPKGKGVPIKATKSIAPPRPAAVFPGSSVHPTSGAREGRGRTRRSGATARDRR
jgi:hypothetical protein